MLKKLKERIYHNQIWWEREKCFTNMEYDGYACFGLCNGGFIWDDEKPELKKLCKGYKYLCKNIEE